MQVISHPSWAPQTSWSKAQFDTHSHIEYVEGTVDEDRWSRFRPVSEHIRNAEEDVKRTTWIPTGDDDTDLWFVFYQSVPGSPYILVMTVPKSDVIAPVTKMLDDVNSTRNSAIVMFVIASALAVGVIIYATTSLGKTLAGPVNRLATLLESGAEDGYQQDVVNKTGYLVDDGVRSDLKKPSSKQMIQMTRAAQDLLVALRFGNPKYAQKDKIKELRNDLTALEMVEALEKEKPGTKSRGIGVCYNNIGNCLSALEKVQPGSRIMYTEVGANGEAQITTAAHGAVGAIQLLSESVANAEKLVATGDLQMSVVGTRLLGKALAQQSPPVPVSAGALASFKQAVEVMAGTGSLDHMALAVTNLSHLSAPPDQEKSVTDPLLQEALTAAAQMAIKSPPLPDTDGSSLLKISIAHAKLNNDPSWIVAALEQSGHASASSVSYAAQVSCARTVL